MGALHHRTGRMENAAVDPTHCLTVLLTNPETIRRHAQKGLKPVVMRTTRIPLVILLELSGDERHGVRTDLCPLCWQHSVLPLRNLDDLYRHRRADLAPPQEPGSRKSSPKHRPLCPPPHKGPTLQVAVRAATHGASMSTLSACSPERFLKKGRVSLADHTTAATRQLIKPL